MTNTEKEFLEEAIKGNLKVLKSPLVDKIKGMYEQTALHFLAIQGCVQILEHPSVDKVKDISGETPLHQLAKVGKIEILDHPTVGEVKCYTWDKTPLHVLADQGKIEVLQHPLIDKVKDYLGHTPLYYFFRSAKKIPKKWIKEKYPWFRLGKRKITEELITEIINTSNTEKFIYQA